MNKVVCLMVAIMALFGTAEIVAQDLVTQASTGRSAEIRIDLPPTAEPSFSIFTGTDRIRLNLPKGSRFPLDFKAASSGLLREGLITSEDEGSVVLELVMAVGLLERVSYEDHAVVLTLTSRSGVMSGTVDVGESYHLGTDDRISVVVHGHPELSATLTISQNGSITLPLIGDIDVAGLTTRDLSARLTDLLGRDYLVNPRIEVEVQEFMSQWVMVSGEVSSQRRVPLKGGTRLKEILSEAGGFIESSGEQITISRRVPGTDELVLLVVERRDFEDGDSNPLLAAGDIVSVSRADYAYLQGEVNSPGRVRIERGMSLLKALSVVGGLTDWANQKTVKILLGEGSKPQTYNLKRIRLGKVADPILTGGEIIVVDRRFF